MLELSGSKVHEGHNKGKAFGTRSPDTLGAWTLWVTLRVHSTQMAGTRGFYMKYRKHGSVKYLPFEYLDSLPIGFKAPKQKYVYAQSHDDSRYRNPTCSVLWYFVSIPYGSRYVNNACFGAQVCK